MLLTLTSEGGFRLHDSLISDPSLSKHAFHPSFVISNESLTGSVVYLSRNCSLGSGSESISESLFSSFSLAVSQKSPQSIYIG